MVGETCSQGAAWLATLAHVAQLVEHVLGKDEVSGSIPLVGSIDAPDLEVAVNVEQQRLNTFLEDSHRVQREI